MSDYPQMIGWPISGAVLSRQMWETTNLNHPFLIFPEYLISKKSESSLV
jgi:hypothetical protein